MTLRNLAQWLVWLEIPILSLIYFYFVVTDAVPLAAFGLIALIWLARVWTTGKPPVGTPLDLPVVILLVMLPVSLAVTSYPWLTLPKVYGVVLSVAFFYAVVNQVKSRRDLAWATLWLVLACIAIALAGLIGTDWAQSKIISASFIYDRLPHVIQGIPRSIAGGFARNGVGGTLTLVVPLLAALGLVTQESGADERGQTRIEIPLPRSHLPWRAVPGSTAVRIPFRLVVGVALVLSVITLALTQSRGALLGTGVGLLAVAIWRERRFAWLIVVGVVLFTVVLFAGQGNTLAEFVLKMDSRTGTLASRLEVWQRGVMMVQDFPFTGIGIGTYNEVAHSLYPFFIAAPDEVVAHAHDELLQVAVDVGIPGLIAYVALLTGFVLCVARAYGVIDDVGIRALLAGLGFAMLAHQVFGLTDAFILGTKPGVLMWVDFALAAVVYVRRGEWTIDGGRKTKEFGRPS